MTATVNILKQDLNALVLKPTIQ